MWLRFCKGRKCTFYKGKPSHCAGHFQASSHCVGRARDAGYDWMGLIDPDEYWFSPRYGTLPSLLSAERQRGSVGVGQNAFVYGPGGATGREPTARVSSRPRRGRDTTATRRREI